jgi:2-phospho-L-lactate guanylyltransferase
MTGGTAWALVPVKILDAAKRRLAGALDLAGRRGLMRAMLADVLDTLMAAPGLDGVAVISRDKEVARQVGARGVRVLPETGVGLNAAVAQAARILAGEGCATMLVVAADVPLARPEEIAEILGAQRAAPALTLVPDRHRVGTNALACTPPAACTPRFGGRSLERHLEAAHRAGIPVSVLELPGLGLDLDTPDDLAVLRQRPGTTRTQAFLRDLPEPAASMEISDTL